MHMGMQYRIAVGLLLLALIGAVGTYMDWWSLYTFIGPFVLGHWMVITAAAYLVIAVPLYALAKRRTAASRGGLLKFHVFGNLLAFVLIAAHFAQQMGRPAESAPSLGTGLAGFLLVALVVAAGFMLRFGLASAWRTSWRMLHVGLSLSLLVVIGIHALRNFGLF